MGRIKNSKPKYHLSLNDKLRILEICDARKKSSLRKLAECASSVLERPVNHNTISNVLKQRKEIEECNVGKRGAYLVRPKNNLTTKTAPPGGEI